MLSVVIEGVVDIQTDEGETWVAAVDAGFLSVANNRVSVLAERAEMSHEIDLEKARHDLERAKAAGENDDAAAEAAGPRPDPRPWRGLLTRPSARRTGRARVVLGLDLTRHEEARMPVWQLLLDAAGGLLALVLLYGIALIARRRMLSRTAGQHKSATASGLRRPGAVGCKAATRARPWSGSASSPCRPGRSGSGAATS